MPEEKKEKFTFSDKIKNSKPAGNKSFAKSSAKIGRDGKPKATLFERTRRDAPFFIAALVALLLLPFLYKYSGQATEEQLLTPGNEQTDFDPERYGFDTAMIEDPDGQVAQLAGRDSLSLIKGWGSNEEEDYGRDDMDLDASSSYEGEAEGQYAAEKHSSSEMDVEDNTTNIYKRRAGAATRAAFRRTKIGTLNPAGLRRPGGSRLGINNWGGGMKGAARKVGPTGPRNAPKPVSLQPLRAAGSRSSFGQGGAAAARKSKDNMGKANPIEALRDSYVKPVEPTRVGGLDMFSMGPGGGSGKLNRNINITPGKEPWWWDMMKTRMQKEWEARFNRKWNWINFLDKFLQNILGQVANCLITGDSDGDVDNFLGASGESSSEETCCGWTAKKLDPEKLEKVGGDVKRYCDSKVWKNELIAAGADCDRGYKGVVSVKGKRGPIAQRLCCFGICGSAYASGELGLGAGAGMQCADMPNYTVIPSGEARKWNIYTYVVARNYFPDSLKGKFPALPTSGKNLLCSSMDRKHGGSSLNHADITAGVGHVKAQKDSAKEKIIAQTKATKNIPQEQQEIRERTLEVDQESLGDSCVIVVSRGNVLPYEAMKNKIMDLFKELGNGNVTEQEAEKAFYELDLMFVSSFAAKDKLAYAQWFESGHHLKNLLPLPYWEFENAYIEHKKITHKKDGSRDNVYNKKRWRVEGTDMVRGAVCYYGNLNIECGPDNTATAKLHFDRESFKGGSGVKPTAKDVTVSASFRYLDNPQGVGNVFQPMVAPTINPKDPFTFHYTFEKIISTDAVKKLSDSSNVLRPDANGKWDLVGTIRWTATRGKEVIKKDCPLNQAGDTPVQNFIQTEECTDGAMEKSPDPKVAGKCQQQRVCKNGKWGPWEDVPGDVDCGSKPNDPIPPAGGVVHFYDNITKVPCDTDIAKGERRLKDASGCLKWNSCKLTVDRALLLQPLDAETKGYVARAKAKFDKANMGQKISLDYYEDSLSVANLIDAIMIDPDNGTVPANTVCLLGKTIGANSLDPQTKNGKTKNLKFDNIFGTFLAFIGYDASSFPSQKTHDCDGAVIANWRFYPCSATIPNYYWGAYVSRGNRSGYKKEIDSGAWAGLPLAELQREPLPTRDGVNLSEVNDEKSRATYHQRYEDLLKREPCQYPSGKTVQRANVIEYINRLCTYGDQIKPHAWNKIDCKQRVQKDPYALRHIGCPDC